MKKAKNNESENHIYNPSKIEPKWQKVWDKKKVFEANDTKEAKGGTDMAADNSRQKKFYGLIEFPYPSGEGLHVGHIRSNTAMDIISRKRRMEGFNVLYPIGWDAFGLPTENYAIKTGIHPTIVTKKNTNTFREQLKSLGFSFDWSREINTTDPEYYRWTQWIFLQLYKHGLAYKKRMPINWCPKDKIGLANEEVVDGKCERCGATVEKKEKEQWMLAITKYADRLDKDLDTVDYLEKIKVQQRNWIGRSEGAKIKFKITNYKLQTNSNTKIQNDEIEVFTTRPDTLFGVTYLVLSPEHPFIDKIQNYNFKITNKDEIQSYINEAKNKSEIERIGADKEKTGVEIKGIKAINLANNEEIPIWIADYVLADYGTGAVMAVPAHDERDWDFAKKYNLQIREVINGGEISKSAYVGTGTMVNSGNFNGMNSEEVKWKITEFVGGEKVTTYKLRDWVFSRQHYWGEPIPMVYCENCKVNDPKSDGWVPVREEDLPVKLPKVEKYQPTNTGESPLANVTKWVNTKCPKCKGKAKRETDTMPNWAGSSWYYWSYVIDKLVNNNQNPKSKIPSFAKASEGKQISKQIQNPKFKEILKYWLPVDWYNGGMEHTTLHLLYSRFWHKFLYDIGVVPTAEPYQKRTSHGMILAENGMKMSKSRGNVINPDDLVKRFGADALRVYEMFMGPFDQAINWNTDGLVGTRRFLEKVFRIKFKIQNSKLQTNSNIKIQNNKLESLIHKTVKKVTEDIEDMRFNTAVSALMICANTMDDEVEISQDSFEDFLKILAPFAPHISEELWASLGHKELISQAPWPQYDPNKIVEEDVNIAVQINGKVRFTFKAKMNMGDEELKDALSKNDEYKKWTMGKEIKKIIVVKNRLISVVI